MEMDPECAAAEKSGSTVVTKTGTASGIDCPATPAPPPPGEKKPPGPPEEQTPPGPPGEQTPPGDKSSPPGQPPAPPPGTPFCPGTVPSCIKTFMDMTGKQCRDAFDVGCYCTSDKVVDAVYNCMFAWRQDDEDYVKARMMFQALCAQFIPKHPAIATAAETMTSSAARP
ncbi:hypothetical protein CDD83_6441 [Cordyceps sp. RAO-2017]|nr:hypothetical protein CDD83_6441 [Cordyceps sp. RAO-2017]